jgi:hypothetical protein
LKRLENHPLNSPTTGDVNRNFGFAIADGDNATGDPSSDTVDRFWVRERKSRVGAVMGSVSLDVSKK